MLALQIVEQGQPLQRREVPRPTCSSEGVLIEVKAAGICRSDVHYMDNTHKLGPLPQTPGHEIAGVIVEVGSGVPLSRVGQRVCVHYLQTCRKCKWCCRNNEQFCPHSKMIGKDINGGYQEFISVPAANAIPTADCLSFSHAAVLCCSTATCFHALKNANLTVGESLAIFGVGGLGFSALLLSKTFQSGNVFAIDVVQSKLDAAQKLGAIPINASEVDVVETLRSLTDGHGVDVSLELCGVTSATVQAVKCLAIHGRAVLVGIGGNQTLEGVDIYRDILGKETHIIGCSDHLGSELEELVELADHGDLDLSKVVTHEVPFEDVEQINSVLNRLRQNRQDACEIRTVITF